MRRRGPQFLLHLFVFLLTTVAIAAVFVACGEDADPINTGDSGRPDAPFIDSGGNPPVDGSSSGNPDANTGSDAPVVDTGPTDTTPPGRVGDLTATQKNHAAIDLAWSAPGDDPDAGASSPDAGSGTVAAYEVRYAKTAITNVTEFLAATAAATPPAPKPAGQPQTFTVTGLEPATTYHFVVRARDAAGNSGALSNDASATTKPRAKLLITEVAVSNTATEGFDFIEAIVTTAGWAEGLEFKQLGTSLHTLAPFDLAVGDRVVVHASGLPGPAGFAQEDVSKDKAGSTATFATTEAFDVYSATAGLTATDNLLTINDGVTIVDALAVSNRDNDAVTATMTAWAAARTANAWMFAAAPVDATNDCETQRDAVNVTEDATDVACGGYATGYVKGMSINRSGTTDTNTKNDFYLAAQTTGAANNAAPPFRVVSITAPSATQLVLTFNGEVAPGTVNAGAFTIAGLTTNAAATMGVDRVSLTTAAQGEQAYAITVANTVTSIQGTALQTPTLRACGFSATPATAILSEVNANITGGADLIELAVTARGNLGGFELYQNPTAVAAGTLLARLPTVCADVGDIVVVHLSSTVGAVAPFSEAVVSKSEFAQATFGVNYDAAWDVFGLSGLGFTSQVITLKNAATLLDAAAFNGPGTAPAGFVPALQFIQASGKWLPADCAGALCTATSVPSADDVSAVWNGSGTASTGNSVRRLNPPTSSAAGWAVGASSFGLANP